MAATHESGPTIVYGALLNLAGSGGAGTSGNNPEAGPSGTYQGDCILDPRFTYQPGVTGRGKVSGFLDSPYVMLVDGVPNGVGGGTRIAAAQTATSGTAMTLAAALFQNITPNCPIVPFGQAFKASNVVLGLGLDFGFTIGICTAGSPQVSIQTRVGLLAPGVCVLIAGGTGGSVIPATVLSVSGITVTLDTPMAISSSGVPVALANGSGQNAAGPAASPPVAFSPYLTVGAMSVFDPTSAISRGTSVTSNNAGDTGWTVTVAGYDIYSVPMHETITVTANGVAYGWKAFKFITSVTPNKAGGGATTGTLAIGTSDLFGCALREDYWESANNFWNGSYLTANTGWTAADTTSPATATTKDVRGTYQISSVGPNGSGATAVLTNNNVRLSMYQTLHPYALFGTTPANLVPLFGVPQF